MLISIIDLSKEELNDYIQQIQASNLTRFTQNGLIDLLKTVQEQTEQSKKMGWLR